MASLQEKIDLADEICGTLSAQEWGEMASILFDRVEANYSTSDVQVIASQLTEAGVAVDGICKKKHPHT